MFFRCLLLFSLCFSCSPDNSMSSDSDADIGPSQDSDLNETSPGSDADGHSEADADDDRDEGSDGDSDVTSDADSDGGTDAAHDADSDGDANSATDADTDGDPDVDDDPGHPPGLPDPCENGPGWTLFSFHYDDRTSPDIDIWNATCDYSFAWDSACNVVDVGSVSLVHEGYAVEVSGGDYIRVRFSVEGLEFSGATFYVQARSYATSSSTFFEVESPLYGIVEGGPVDNDWVFDWYGVDWSDFLYPDDRPAMTAIQLYAGRGSGSLAVHAVELCVHSE